jgi:hypothetical protein
MKEFIPKLTTIAILVTMFVGLPIAIVKDNKARAEREYETYKAWTNFTGVTNVSISDWQLLKHRKLLNTR